jgi:hypothetical protein
VLGTAFLEAHRGRRKMPSLGVEEEDARPVLIGAEEVPVESHLHFLHGFFS